MSSEQRELAHRPAARYVYSRLQLVLSPFFQIYMMIRSVVYYNKPIIYIVGFNETLCGLGVCIIGFRQVDDFS